MDFDEEMYSDYLNSDNEDTDNEDTDNEDTDNEDTDDEEDLDDEIDDEIDYGDYKYYFLEKIINKVNEENRDPIVFEESETEENDSGYESLEDN